MQQVRLLAAAFPRSSWRDESDAAYTLALTTAGVNAPSVGAAIASLIHEESELPTVALILRRCRELSAQRQQATWYCPECRSTRIAGTVGGTGVCFDCDWEGTLA